MDGTHSFGYWLRRRRKALDLTQAELAQRASCSLNLIQKIEADARRPSRQMAEKLAESLGLEPAERRAFVQAARAERAVDKLVVPSLPAERPRQSPRSRLPAQLTTLIGREQEVERAFILLQGNRLRLLTLTGPGGIGKTRLAIALAERLLATDRFPDGIFFVPLAPIETADQIVLVLAEALDFSLYAGQGQVRSPQQQVFDYLRARRLLLVLDNVEHLLGSTGAAVGDAADWVSALLAAAPDVAIVATSRECLKLREEHVYPVGGLDVPGAEAQLASGAVALFIERARLLRADFAPDKSEIEVVSRICRLVEGMPLAIELAASWVNILGMPTIVAQITQGLDLLATELRDVPARHRSMRLVFDATWHRLSATMQVLFVRLAIFRNGSDRHAVQEVAGVTLPQLRTLVGASLVYYDPPHDRYSLHELLRQYGLEKLRADPVEEYTTRDRHAAYYCAFVQQRGAELFGPGQKAALAALDAERDNVRAAWDWAVSNHQIELLAEAVDGLGYFYAWRGLFDDGARAYHVAAARLEAALADEVKDAPVLARLCAWHGAFRHRQGDVVSAEQLFRKGLSLLDTLSTSGPEASGERAFILLNLGIVASQSQPAQARHYFEESLNLYQALGQHWEAGRVHMWRGELARQEGAFDEAHRHLRASLAILEVCGDQRGIADVLDLDSQVAAETGQLDEAEALTRQSYAFRVELGDVVSRAAGLGRLGLILLWSGKYDQASTPLTQSLGLYQELGDRAAIAAAQWRLAIALRNLGDYDAAWHLNQQATPELRQQGPSGLAQAAWNAGTIALARGTHHHIELLLTESVELCRQNGYVRDLGWVLPLLGYTHWLLGNTERAQAEQLEVLRTAVRHRELMPLLFATLTIAVMLAERGGNERAVELYAMAWRYPFFANSQNCIDMFGRRLDAVVAALPPEKAQAAQARGLVLDLWSSARELLADLSIAWGVVVAELE